MSELEIDAGFAEQQLQRSPHLVLLSPDWYQRNLKPVMAKWMLLWLEANHLCTRLSQPQLVAYLTSDGAGLVGPDAGVVAAARALDELHARMARSNIDAKSFQLLNLCSDWLRIYLPHVLQKIDRVSFGLLSAEEHARLLKGEPHMPRSRFKLAIPFVGKDCPSRASEFAHPDVIIALTVLAYRYEGLRRAEFKVDVIGLLRSNFENEVGPYNKRASSLIYQSWVQQAGGAVKGQIGRAHV